MKIFETKTRNYYRVVTSSDGTKTTLPGIRFTREVVKFLGVTVLVSPFKKRPVKRQTP